MVEPGKWISRETADRHAGSSPFAGRSLSSCDPAGALLTGVCSPGARVVVCRVTIGTLHELLRCLIRSRRLVRQGQDFSSRSPRSASPGSSGRVLTMLF